MSNRFFDQPILNSPYECPQQHWELDGDGQPTQKIEDFRRKAKFITPIPKAKKRKRVAAQDEIVFDEGKGISTKEQHYDPTLNINEVRGYVDTWRNFPVPANGRSHWRHNDCSSTRASGSSSGITRLKNDTPIRATVCGIVSAISFGTRSQMKTMSAKIISTDAHRGISTAACEHSISTIAPTCKWWTG